MIELDSLAAEVQNNCHISDALFARDYSLCIYLLKMREYFRWEKGYRYGDNLPDKELGEWLVEREQLWHELEERPFQSLRIGSTAFDPFTSEAINAALLPHGLVYSGGYGSGAKPHFFLAHLEREMREEALHVLVAGREYARDLTAPPAMTQGATVYVRRESLRRLLWERLEEWRWRKQQGPMARAASKYPFDTDFDAALDAMTDTEIDSLILHERGEQRVGAEVGPVWEEMLASVARTRTEFVLRAVRDHFADCLVTLPRLLEQEFEAPLHFYFANLTGMRRSIFPALMKAYERWTESGDRTALQHAAEAGARHWREMALALLACHREKQEQKMLEKLAETVGL